MSAAGKHTPGPWSLGGSDGDGSGGEGYIYCDNSLGSAVAIAFGECLPFPVFSREEEIANARLIAAAPDLLAVCQKVVGNWGDLHHKDLMQLRAVIAKAEGGEA